MVDLVPIARSDHNLQQVASHLSPSAAEDEFFASNIAARIVTVDRARIARRKIYDIDQSSSPGNTARSFVVTGVIVSSAIGGVTSGR